MVRNMKNYNEVRNKIESILTSLNIDYTFLNLEDDDLNYSIDIPTLSNKLKLLNSIHSIMYLCDDFTLNFISPNIYVIKNDEELSPYYEIINDANISLTSGSYTIFDAKDCNVIVYRSSINCGNEFSELNEELIRLHILLFLSSLEDLLEALKKLRKDHK